MHVEFLKIYTVNFNTTKLTNNLIRSILKNIRSFHYNINIFDNSTTDKFVLADDLKKYSFGIHIHDNTAGNIINFDKVLQDNVDYQHYTLVQHNDQSRHGTLKHSYTINHILNNEQDNILLFDSDTIVLKDIDFIDDKYFTIADICYQEPRWKNRFYPFIQFFNTKMYKQHNIQFFDKNRILFGANKQNNLIYDTGASFYEDTLNYKLPYKQIDYKKYIIHLAGGSWIKSNIIRTKFAQAYSR